MVETKLWEKIPLTDKQINKVIEKSDFKVFSVDNYYKRKTSLLLILIEREIQGEINVFNEGQWLEMYRKSKGVGLEKLSKIIKKQDPESYKLVIKKLRWLEILDEKDKLIHALKSPNKKNKYIKL